MTEHNERSEFASDIKEKLKRKGVTQKYLATLAGLSEATVSKALNDKNKSHDPTTFQKFAKALDDDPQRLIEKKLNFDTTKPANLDQTVIDLLMPVENIFGRSSEIEKLIEYCDRNKLILITGLAGIGKSSLAKSLQHLGSDKFDAVIFLRLNFNPAIAAIAESMRDRSNVRNASNAIADIIRALQEKRYLLILDGLDIDHPEHSQDYHHLLQQIAETEHKSCAIVTCQALPKKEYRSWYPLPKVVTLKGLDEIDAIQLLENKGLEIEPQNVHIQELITRYDGNPASLIYAVQDVLDLHQGNVKDYLNCNTFGAKRIKEQVTGIFGRLSALELELLYWLTLQSKAFETNEIITTFPDLYKNSPHKDDVRDALDELIRRSLLQHGIELVLAHSVQLCAEDYLSRTLSREIKNLKLDSLDYLRSIELSREKVNLRDRISRVISEATLCQSLNKLEDPSNQLSVNAIGYAIENLRYLLGKSHDNHC